MNFNSRNAGSLCIRDVGLNFFKCPLDLIGRLIDVLVFPFLVVV